MSKGNFLMNTVSGKLGSMVLFRRKGEQIERTYVKKFTNPNTRAQATQRSQLANLVQFYRSAKRLLNHSFCDRPTYQSSYNAFVGANLSKIGVYLTKDIADKNACVVAPYIVSHGGLPSIQITGTGDNAITNIALGTLSVGEATTIGELTTAILANNASIQEGDQLSYISFIQGNDVQLSVPTVSVSYYEITLNSTSDKLVLDYMPAQAVANVGGFLAHGSHFANGGFCWVLSRKDVDGSLTCSTQNIIMNDMTVFNQYQGEVAVTRAVDSYKASLEYFLTPGDDSEASANTQYIVSSVTIGGKSFVNGSTNTVSLSSGSNNVVISGTGLEEVTAVTIVLNGNSYTVADVTATDGQITGTISVSSSDTTVTSASAKFGGSSVWSWTQSTASGGGQDVNPLS